MVSEVICHRRIVWLGRIVDIIRVSISVRVVLESKVAVCREEVPTKDAFILISQVPMLNIDTALHAFEGLVVFILCNHCRLWLEVRSVVPSVLENLLLVDCHPGECVTTYHACKHGIPSESEAGCSTCFNVDERIHKAGICWDDWDSSLVVFCSATNKHAKRPAKNTTNCPMKGECKLVLFLDLI